MLLYRGTTPPTEDLPRGLSIGLAPALPSSRPRKVLFLDHTAKPCGGELARLNLVCSLDPDRYVPAVGLFSEGPLCDWLGQAGIETHVLHIAPALAGVRKGQLDATNLQSRVHVLHCARFRGRLTRFISEQRPDQVHCHSLKADVRGGVASRLADIPVIWHIRDRIADDYLPHRVASIFRWRCHRVPTYVVAKSHGTLRTLPLNDGTASSSAAVVHRGVRLQGEYGEQSINTPGRDGRPLRHGAGAPSDPVVGLVGRIAQWKGQHVFLRAAARVIVRFPQARFQIIGSSLIDETDYEREIRALAGTLDPTEKVVFTRFRADVLGTILHRNVIVHASIAGGPFGQFIVKRMAADKPVVGTCGNGALESVVHGETGLLVPRGDMNAMADAIESPLMDPARAPEIGLRRRNRVHDRFTIQMVAENMPPGFERVVSTRPARHSARQKSRVQPNSILLNEELAAAGVVFQNHGDGLGWGDAVAKSSVCEEVRLS